METSVTQAVPDTPSPKPPAEEATEFVVSRKDLLEELTEIQGAVDRRATVPILSHICCRPRAMSCSSPPPISTSAFAAPARRRSRSRESAPFRAANSLTT